MFKLIYFPANKWQNISTIAEFNAISISFHKGYDTVKSDCEFRPPEAVMMLLVTVSLLLYQMEVIPLLNF
jgi:hypothetical protein